jgi:hypothetical protein
MKIASLIGAGLIAVTAIAMPAGATTTTYSDFGSFSAQLSSYLTDDYSDPNYDFINSNAAMTAVLGETRYESTGFNNLNIVESIDDYCAGCNGSFKLYFDATSYGTSNGVFGVGMDIVYNFETQYDAFVTFGDNSTVNYAHVALGFFGLTSDLGIKSIAFGPNGGQSTTGGSFGIDNLTIGSGSGVAAVPEPASWALMISGFGLIGGTMRRRAMRFAIA